MPINYVTTEQRQKAKASSKLHTIRTCRTYDLTIYKFFMKTERPLHNWLTQQIDTICAETMNLLPSRLPDSEEVAGYLRLVAEYADKENGISTSALQKWALENIGDDTAIARDWLLILRVLKQQLSKLLGETFAVEVAIQLWWKIDGIITESIIEVTQLSSENGRSHLLAHIVKLRNQMAQFEESKTNFITVAAHDPVIARAAL